MKKRFLGLWLAVSVALCALPVALGAEPTTFSDVPADHWAAQAVALCARQGIMEGVGEGLFAPEKELSDAECLVLALRLYDLQRGGTGALERAPEDWGKITMTFADGTVVEGDQKEFDFQSFKRDAGFDAHLCFSLAPDHDPEWGMSVDAREATAAIGGKTYTGVSQCWEPAKDGRWVMSFYPYESSDNSEIREYFRRPHPEPGVWYRDWVYTAEKWGLLDPETNPGLGELVNGNLENSDPACRYQFANALYEAAEPLPKLYSVEELPDLAAGDRDNWESVFALYEAGILTGSDEYGTFGKFEALTRGQAAVMVARVLDETQRVQTPPKAMPYLAYTLTEVDLQGWERPGIGGEGEGADWFSVGRWDPAEERWKEAIYWVGGTIWEAELEGGGVYLAPTRSTAGDSRYAHVERRRAEENPADPDDFDHGLFDVETGRLVVPYQSYEDFLAAAQPFWAEETIEFFPWDEDTGCVTFRDKNGDLVIINQWLRRYYNEERVPVSPKFDGIGPINADGQGFVQKDGTVYRIQFE